MSNVPQTRVTVTNFDMPFISLAAFLVKLALAFIPAAVVLAMIAFALSLLLRALGAPI